MAGIANEVSQQGLSASLAAGVQNLSQNQVVTFTQYTKVVLAQDGFVFWVQTAHTLEQLGSLHVATQTDQDVDQTAGVNRVVFTSLGEITEFNAINPQTLWVGQAEYEGAPILIAFNERAALYVQANLWHYSGIAVLPAMQSQLVASAADLPVEPIVSNSLPLWLSQNASAPVYPSFLVPDNVVPPYIVANIDPKDTRAVGPFPMLGARGSILTPGTAPIYEWASSQLMSDEVELILYGLNNQQAIQYLTGLMEFSTSEDETGGPFGFMSSPVLQDDKRVQSEITAIAMKKTLHFRASYYMATADAFARRYILSAGITTGASPP